MYSDLVKDEPLEMDRLFAEKVKATYHDRGAGGEAPEV
jgi:hypothetical protein